ncbi:FAD binding domain-containing protein [Mucilaginibacter auburnensis]|uniref:Xanthine dehydrogenase YagS FAD-binding subunit n=1 Tax=Mucilaginibacter auburnensis TaxID=1457233 RepID=A0A2H9VM21_9SPHI|nr:xanthine dehydrogenase family protein subunit M [Mucilaginibacter auburnensis]PJJ79362.1 xanthine dehydrogenase YagS FAD-binding subunit [Mucilaginibacter auburnensis]
MRPFKFTKADSATSAVNLLSKNINASFLAGGTNIIDLMKEDVAHPDELINLGGLTLTGIKQLADGGLTLGALGKNTEAANHPVVRKNYPLLSKAILAGASAQIRNMATNGGNLLQRTRCSYFYDVSMPCNKREPGTGCGAMEGINRMHAIFGWSESCIAVYPSDMAVALLALNARVKVLSIDGKERTIAMADFHRLAGNQPEKDNNLQRGDLITAIEIPPNNFAAHSAYVKVRDRNSYAFALVSVAAALNLSGNTISSARITMGGVAHKPWAATEAEAFLKGKSATEANFREAAEIAMRDAKPLEHNKFKVEMGKRTIVLALKQALKG